MSSREHPRARGREPRSSRAARAAADGPADPPRRGPSGPARPDLLRDDEASRDAGAPDLVPRLFRERAAPVLPRRPALASAESPRPGPRVDRRRRASRPRPVLREPRAPLALRSPAPQRGRAPALPPALRLALP